MGSGSGLARSGRTVAAGSMLAGRGPGRAGSAKSHFIRNHSNYRVFLVIRNNRIQLGGITFPPAP